MRAAAMPLWPSTATVANVAKHLDAHKWFACGAAVDNRCQLHVLAMAAVSKIDH